MMLLICSWINLIGSYAYLLIISMQKVNHKTWILKLSKSCHSQNDDSIRRLKVQASLLLNNYACTDRLCTQKRMRI